MARTVEEILREQLGTMSLQIAGLIAQLEALREENTKLKAEHKTEPTA